MKPAPDTVLFFVENQGVLFSESAQKLYHLNESAALIWCLLEDGQNEQSIIQSLESTYEMIEDEAQLLLSKTLTLFSELHVLAGTELKAECFTGDAVLDIDVPGVKFIDTRYYRLLDSIIAIRFSSPEQIQRITTVFKHLVIEGPKVCDITIDIVQTKEGQHILCRDGLPYRVCTDFSNLGPLTKALVWASALNRYDYFINIHAGVVGNGIDCYLFPANPGSGKSTLMAALVHHGFEFFSDEMALLEQDSFMVGPVPLAICIKNTGVAPLLSYYPKLASELSHRRGDGKIVQYVSPPMNRVPEQSVRRPIAAIIFPQYQPDVTTHLQAIDKLSALERLSEQFLVVTRHLTHEMISQLIDWLESTPCYELKLSDTHEAIQLIQNLSTELP